VLLTERTQMLAGVSHDLRTPLTRMRLQLSMMPDNPEKMGLLEDVNQMQHMIEEFLNYARGAHPEKRQLCSFKALIDDLIQEHQGDYFKMSAHYFGIKRQNPLNVSIKKTLVKRLLTNLIVNSKVSGTLLKITVSAKERYLQVFVDDNGCGIPVHERENVFEPFYRLDSARHSEKGSVGLGLSIVRDAVRSHGGEVFLEDSPLGGVRVVLNLPT
ncbi:MAG: ATP-binding protein, partial [Alphaproteobacteria bacterium]|nr:ATP-binding protein [Alphaproteobacteria bacterium]